MSLGIATSFLRLLLEISLWCAVLGGHLRSVGMAHHNYKPHSRWHHAVLQQNSPHVAMRLIT